MAYTARRIPSPCGAGRGSGRGVPGEDEVLFKQCFQGFPLSPALSPLVPRGEREKTKRRFPPRRTASETEYLCFFTPPGHLRLVWRLRACPEIRSWAAQAAGPLALKQDDNVMFLNVQSKYILLLHWGCEMFLLSTNVPFTSLNCCVSGSSSRPWQLVTGSGLRISRASAC